MRIENAQRRIAFTSSGRTPAAAGIRYIECSVDGGSDFHRSQRLKLVARTSSACPVSQSHSCAGYRSGLWSARDRLSTKYPARPGSRKVDRALFTATSSNSCHPAEACWATWLGAVTGTLCLGHEDVEASSRIPILEV